MADVYKNWVRSRIASLKDYFFMQEWSVDIIWESVAPTKTDGDSVASINTDHNYFQSTITIYPKFEELWIAGRIDKLVEVLVHEFSHVLTEPLYDMAWRSGTRGEAQTLAASIREQQTQRVALVILRGLPKKFFKKAI